MLTALRSIFLFLFNFHFTSKTIQPWSISRHRERDFPDFNSLLFDELHQTFLDFYRSVLFFIVFKSYEFHILTTELPRYLYALIERDKWKREFGGWYDGMEVFVTRPSIRKKKNADSMSRARGVPGNSLTSLRMWVKWIEGVKQENSILRNQASQSLSTGRFIVFCFRVLL